MGAGEPGTIVVQVRYKDVEQTFTGNVDDVWVSLNRFFAEMIPAFSIVGKVTLTVDLEKLVEDCEDIIAVTSEGPAILVAKKLLTDGETLALHLLSAYVGSKLGLLDKDSLTKEELQAGLGKTPKITSTRLGELCRQGLTEKTTEDTYRITTLGIRSLQEETLPRIKARQQG